MTTQRCIHGVLLARWCDDCAGPEWDWARPPADPPRSGAVITWIAIATVAWIIVGLLAWAITHE